VAGVDKNTLSCIIVILAFGIGGIIGVCFPYSIQKYFITKYEGYDRIPLGSSLAWIKSGNYIVYLRLIGGMLMSGALLCAWYCLHG